jgi:hypothetical protein
MIEKKKLGCRLFSVVVILSLALPLLSPAVEASPATEIRDWYELDGIRNGLVGHYVLMNNLDANTAGYEELASPSANHSKGWEPIGIYESGGSFAPFVGIFDGQGYEIRDLVINRADEMAVGLFGAVVGWEEGGVVENVHVVNANVTGDVGVGALVGLNGGAVSNCYSSGNITGDSRVGGVVGLNIETVIGCSFEGMVTGYSILVGGLVGYSTGNVSNSYSDGSVTGGLGAGGLVGLNEGTVSDSGAESGVTGDDYVGGLVGHNQGGTVGNCYASGNAIGDVRVGGVVGFNDKGGTVARSYASGSVAGGISTGGLVGYNRGTVRNSYSSGSVSGDSSVGGFVGDNEGIVRNCFWDRDTSTMETSDGGAGKTTIEMMDIATFTDTRTQGLNAPWDIAAVANGETNDAYTWNLVDGESYPFLSGKQFITHNLTISSTEGGSVAVPGEGTHTLLAGEVVNLSGDPEAGYRFVNWSGDVDTIADVNAAETSITMQGDYVLTANFEREVSEASILGIVVGVVVVGVAVFFVLRRRGTAARNKGR